MSGAAEGEAQPSPSASSSTPPIVFASVFAILGLGWVGLASWLVDSGWGRGVLPDWLLRISPALAVVIGGALGFYVVLRRSLARQRRLVRERLAAEEMLLTSQKLEALGVLAAGIAHDFNNTLTVIRGMTELAKMESYDSRVSRSAMEAIHLATIRAEEIARQLMAFLSQPREQFHLCDLNVITREFAPIVRQAAGTRTTVEYDLEYSLPAAKLNRGMLEQAQLNLVINARDAIGGTEAPRIKITTRSVVLTSFRSLFCPEPVSGRFIELSVSDTGCGIAKEDIARVFAPFFTTKRHGTGLGLASVLRAVQQHEGFVDVRSELGQGTCIKLIIPVERRVRDEQSVELKQDHSVFA